MEINKLNSDGDQHGYWDDSCRKKHCYNGLNLGLYVSHMFKCHYINDKEIGCEYYNNDFKYQYFFNKPRKKFGEMITWK